MLNIYSTYLSDPIIAELCNDKALISKMIKVEIVLAKVQSELGVIPKKEASEIQKHLTDVSISINDLTDDVLKNGIPTIGLLKQLKKGLSSQAQDYLHWGATSQDILDTAQVLILKGILSIFKNRIQLLLTTLKDLAHIHRKTIMSGRTRTQQASPIYFGEKVTTWYKPLERHLQRLEEMSPRVLNIQFAGSVGNLSVLGDKAEVVAKKMAVELDLGYIGTWHSQRDSIAEFSSWVTLVAGSLGKMAGDILLLSQNEIGEVIENRESSGKSSTMPHKKNPVLSEAISALSSHIKNINLNMVDAMKHDHERDGKAMILEWLTIPMLIKSFGAMLNHSLSISKNIVVDENRMKLNLDSTLGLVFSERVSFALAEKIGRSKAKELTSKACQEALETSTHLLKILEKQYNDHQINWSSIFNLD